MAFYSVQETNNGNLEFTFKRVATNPYKWEVIKEECRKRGLDPFSQLDFYIRGRLNRAHTADRRG